MMSVNSIHKAMIAILFFITTINARAQKLSSDHDWQNLDLEKDSIFGISTAEAYSKLLLGKKSRNVIVAVIDGGVDIEHEDLKNVIWTNKKEIEGNGIDDDKNGYIDDIHGWNFLGSSKGNFHFDNSALVRSLRAEYKSHPDSRLCAELRQQLEDQRNIIRSSQLSLENQKSTLISILANMANDDRTLKDFQFYAYRNEDELNMILLIIKYMRSTGNDFAEFNKEFENKLKTYRNQLDYVLNIDYDPRKGNKEFSQKYYGNGDVKGLDPSHGTYSAGIIAAIRNNGIGMNGIADNVSIMSVRAIPEGDMLERDLAKAIRYAVDNGAEIINLSVNSNSSTDKAVVDEAVKYAMDKNVLIVHSSGNQGKEEITEASFPNRDYADGGKAQAWIEVGASGPTDDLSLLAPFSNYGKTTTDVFAPGMKIWCTAPGNKYVLESGTSMATPLVSGMAAVLKEYYPTLTAYELRNIIMSSVTPVKHDIRNKSGNLLNFSYTCASGGIVNIYNALIFAAKNIHLNN